MRVIVCLVFALAVCVAAQSSSRSESSLAEHSLPLCSDCPKPKLTLQQKVELQAQNLDQANRLKWYASRAVRIFVLALEDKKATFIRLSNAIRDGHSVRFKFLEGQESDLAALASTYPGLKINGDSIEVAESDSIPQHHTNKFGPEAKAASKRWADARKDPDVKFPVPERVNKFVSAEQAESLASGNRARLSALAPDAAPKVQKFLDTLAASRNYIRLYGAIRNGHIVDYELLNGSRSELKSKGQALGLLVTDSSIATEGTLSTSADQKEVETFDAKAEESSLQSNGCAKKPCPKEGDVIIVPAPGKVLRSNQPNVMVLDVQMEKKFKL